MTPRADGDPQEQAHAAAGGDVDMRPPPAVIVGLASVIGLQTARLLAENGVRVIGVAGDGRHYAARTRACERVIEADVHGEGFVDVLEKLGADLGEKSVLVPCTDNAVLVASRHRERLAEWYHLPLSDHATVTQLADKAAFADMMAEHRLPVPRTQVIAGRAEAAAAAADLDFPVVVKPSVKTPAWRAATSAKVVKVDTPAELLGLVSRVEGTVPALVAQEYVAGADDLLHTCNGYIDRHGRPLVTFTSRKQRQWPPHLGIASYAQSRRDDAVAKAAVDLFQAVGFHGLGYLEMKQDPTTGRLLTIEANVGRPTGRSAAAEASGVQLLMTMYCDAAGLTLPDAAQRLQPAQGPAWIDLRRDTMAAWHYWRRGELRLRDWLAELRRPTVHAVFCWKDPEPFAYDVAQSARKAMRRLLRGWARRLTVPSDS